MGPNVHRKVDCKVKFMCQEEIGGDVWKMNSFGQEAAGVRRWSGCQPAPGPLPEVLEDQGKGTKSVRGARRTAGSLEVKEKKTTTAKKPQALFDESFNCVEIDDLAYF